MSSQKVQAFTLIELLVVMAIIALLSSIILGTMGGVQELAERKSCMLQLTLIGEGLSKYRVEYGFYPPSFDGTNNLGYVLNHPQPSLPKTRANRDFSKSEIGYPNGYLWGKLEGNSFDYSAIDWDTLTLAEVKATPIPLYDPFICEGQEFGTAYTYVYALTPRIIYTLNDFNYDVRTHSQQGFQGGFDLWSNGEDGIIDSQYHLHNLTLVENKDNITTTVYK